MTTNETARVLGYSSTTYVERLIRAGTLRATKVRGKWNVDEEAVREYQRRVSSKRSSTSNAQAARDRKRAEAREMFA
jgi:excisionase family DNA binding protein